MIIAANWQGLQKARRSCPRQRLLGKKGSQPACGTSPAFTPRFLPEFNVYQRTTSSGFTDALSSVISETCRALLAAWQPISPAGEDSALDFGTSFNSLGHDKISKISIMPKGEASQAAARLAKIIGMGIRYVDEKRVVYESVDL